MEQARVIQKKYTFEEIVGIVELLESGKKEGMNSQQVFKSLGIPYGSFTHIMRRYEKLKAEKNGNVVSFQKREKRTYKSLPVIEAQSHRVEPPKEFKIEKPVSQKSIDLFNSITNLEIQELLSLFLSHKKVRFITEKEGEEFILSPLKVRLQGTSIEIHVKE